MKNIYGNQEGWFSVADGLEFGRGVIVTKESTILPMTPLNLFPKGFGSRVVALEGISEYLLSHGVERKNGLVVVPHFNTPEEENFDEPGWFLNHSDEPNVLHDPFVHPALFLSAVALKPGVELKIDYNFLREPNTKPYYARPISNVPQYTMPAHLL